MLKCPDEFTVKFGKRLVKYLDPMIDISIINRYWCWKDFESKFGYLKPKVIKYFEQVKEGNPSLAIYNLTHHCNFDKKWAEDFISNCKIGDPSYAAYLMVRDCNSDYKWIKNIISNCKVGDPSYIIYLMTFYYENFYRFYIQTDINWIKKFLNNCKIGDPCSAVYNMVRYCNFDKIWAIEFISNCKIGDPIRILNLMKQHCNLDQKMLNDIIFKLKKKEKKYVKMSE